MQRLRGQRLEWALAVLDSVRAVHREPWQPFRISTTSDYTDLCSALQYQWGELGIEVEVDVVSAAAHRDRVATGKAALFRKSWLADYPDAENFLALFHSKNFAPSGPNYTHFSDEQFDASVRLGDGSDRSARKAGNVSKTERSHWSVHACCPVVS